MTILKFPRSDENVPSSEELSQLAQRQTEAANTLDNPDASQDEIAESIATLRSDVIPMLQAIIENDASDPLLRATAAEQLRRAEGYVPREQTKRRAA